MLGDEAQRHRPANAQIGLSQFSYGAVARMSGVFMCEAIAAPSIGGAPSR